VDLTDNQTKLCHALLTIDNPPATPAQLAEATALGYSTVTRLLRELAEAGLAVKDGTGWRATGPAAPAAGSADPTDDHDGDAPAADPDPLPHGGVNDANPSGQPTPQTGHDDPQPGTDAPPDDEAGNGADADEAERITAIPDTAGPTDHHAGDAPAQAPVDGAEPTQPGDGPVGEVSGQEPGGADPDADANADAPRPRLRKGELPQQVLALLRAHPDEAFGPHQLSKLLGARSSGAVGNACDRLVADGLAALANEKPRRFRATPTT
jgi:IclR helix-turn-helix domain